MTGETIKKVCEIMRLATIINPGATCREKTGDKPTVFVEFSGHCCLLTVSVNENGWDADINCEPDIRWRLYLDYFEEDAEKLDEVMAYLKKLAEKLGVM